MSKKITKLERQKIYKAKRTQQTRVMGYDAHLLPGRKVSSGLLHTVCQGVCYTPEVKDLGIVCMLGSTALCNILTLLGTMGSISKQTPDADHFVTLRKTALTCFNSFLDLHRYGSEHSCPSRFSSKSPGAFIKDRALPASQ